MLLTEVRVLHKSITEKNIIAGYSFSIRCSFSAALVGHQRMKNMTH